MRALGAIRTRTDGLLKTAPLPVGLREHGDLAGTRTPRITRELPGPPSSGCSGQLSYKSTSCRDRTRTGVRTGRRPVPLGGGALPFELRDMVVILPAWRVRTLRSRSPDNPAGAYGLLLPVGRSPKGVAFSDDFRRAGAGPCTSSRGQSRAPSARGSHPAGWWPSPRTPVYGLPSAGSLVTFPEAVWFFMF